MDKKYVEVLKKLKTKTQKSLSDENVSWICSIIEKYQPKRILELGVSTGGATAVYLNCIQTLGLACELVSVDTETVAIHKKGKPVIGEEVQALKEELNLENWKLLTGKWIPEIVDELGVFDLIIMDTVHFVPGEILDFLCLKKNIHKHTIIITDDINIESRYPELYPENLNGVSSNAMLLSVLKGTLLFPNQKFPEIAGIILEENKIDENRLLLCLSHKWNTDLKGVKEKYWKKLQELYGKEFKTRVELIYDKYKYSNFCKKRGREHETNA